MLDKKFIPFKDSLSFTIGEHSESIEEGYEQTVIAQEIFIHPKYYETEEYSGKNLIKIHIKSLCFLDKYRYNYDICLARVEKMNLDYQYRDIGCFPKQGAHVPAHLRMTDDDIWRTGVTKNWTQACSEDPGKISIKDRYFEVTVMFLFCLVVEITRCEWQSVGHAFFNIGHFLTSIRF